MQPLTLYEVFQRLCAGLQTNMYSARSLGLQLGMDYSPHDAPHRFELGFQELLNQQCRGLLVSCVDEAREGRLTLEITDAVRKTLIEVRELLAGSRYAGFQVERIADIDELARRLGSSNKQPPR